MAINTINTKAQRFKATLLERSGAVFVEAVTGKDTSATFKDVTAFH